MKIFNKQVNCCNDCPMIDRSEDRFTEPKCNVERYADVSKKNTIISKDCPFGKPVTKEVIEGFGFEYKVFKTFSYFKNPLFLRWYENKEGVYLQLKPKNEILIYKQQDEGKDILFQGEINNPEELEFILCSIGVIE